MNIAFFNWLSFNRISGGIEAVGDRVGRALIAAGHHVCFAALEERYPTGAEVDSILLPCPDKIDSKENAKALVDFFRRHQVEVIVCHSSQSHRTARLMSRVAKEVGATLLFEIHSTPDFYLSRRDDAKTSLRCALSQWARIRRMRRQWRYIHRVGDGVILLAEEYVPIFMREAGLKSPSKLEVIPNPNTYDSMSIEIESISREKMLLFVGRLSEEKGLDLLADIWRQVAPRHPDWRLIVVGDGPMRQELESADLPRCSLEGTQDPTHYYRRASILALTSRYEGWGMVVTESLQHGVVPIAFDSYRALSTLLDQGRCGVMVRPFDTKAYAEQLSRLMSDSDKRSEMSEKGRAWAQHFNLETVLPRWEEVLGRYVDRK